MQVLVLDIYGEERADPEGEALGLPVYVQTVTYDNKVWVMTEKIWSRLQADKSQFYHNL